MLWWRRMFRGGRPRWNRGKVLGRGGSGFVCMASLDQENIDHRGSSLPSIFAVKSVEVAKSKSLHQEKKLIQKLERCPYVIRCYGNDTTTEFGECFYNIMLEYASGGSLLNRIQSLGERLPEDIVSKYTMSILVGLRYIHKCGYVHCDIKPHNILLVGGKDGNGEIVKIADFGAAKLVGQTLKKRSKNSFRGTVRYAAPESVAKGEYEPHSDIWSLGCTVLQMITGKRPWGDIDDPWAVAFRVALKDDVSLEIPSEVSKVAADFLRKCMVRDPKSRWTAEQLLAHSFVSCQDPAGSIG